MPLISSLGVMNAINFGLASVQSYNILAVGGGSATSNAMFYRWDSSGFKTPFSTYASASGTIQDITFNSSNTKVITAGGSGAPVAYSWTNSDGVGTSYSAPLGLAGNANGCGFSKDKLSVFYSHLGSPGISGYNWTDSSGFGTKYADPTQTVSSGRGVSDSQVTSSPYLFYGGSTSSTYINAMSFVSGSGFGTKATNPSTMPSGVVLKTAYSSITAVLYCAVGTLSNQLTAYNWNGTSYGTKFTDAASVPIGCNVLWCDVSPKGDYVIATCTSSPFVLAYSFNTSTGFGSKLTDPTTAVPSTNIVIGNTNGLCTKFSKNGSQIGVTFPSSPYIYTYSFSSSGIGAKYTDPSTIPAAAAPGIKFI